MLFRRFGGAFSLAPYHHVRKFHEQFSAFFNLIMHAGTGAFTCLGDRFSRRGLLGQFLLIQRIAYQRAGGHQSVKGKILENFWLAEKVRESGQQVHCLVGRHAFSFRMYPNGWRELMEGWSKGFASGAGHTPQILTFFVIGWMTGLVLAFIGIVLGGFSWPWLGLYGLCVAQVLWLLRRIGSFHVMTAVFYPAPLVFFFIVFMRSAWLAKRGGDVVWKGRKVRAG
jgi:4,4'-diaponeurosporenoate glycosyltransferase